MGPPWFRVLFGFDENENDEESDGHTDSYEANCAHFSMDADGVTLLSDMAPERRFHVGPFDVMSVAELRVAANAAATTDSSSEIPPPPSAFSGR